MPTTSDHLLSRLREWGVHRIYGYPGDGINAIMGALQKADGDPEFIQARHEEMAAFMACGHGKLSEGEGAARLGVCLATSGPGAIHLLNGLYDAKLDHVPVLAIVGQQPMKALGGSQQQEVDLANLFKDVAAYVQTCTTPVQMRVLVDRAVRIALAERTVTCLIVPTDVQEADAVEEPPHEFKVNPSSAGYVPPRVVPQRAEIERAATVINEGARVAILIGQGARSGADEVVELAERVGGGIAKALLGKDVLPDELPFVTGSIGLLGTRPSYEMMRDCDTLLMVGTSFPYSDWLPEFGKARGVEIDIDAKMIGLRFPTEVNLVGDAGETLRALLPLVERKTDRSWREKIESDVSKWWKVLEGRAMQDAHPLNPQRVFWELSALLPDGCILTCDSGSAANWYARHLKIRRGMRSSLSGTLATMGPGVPYAIAAKMAHPDRPVIALVGDGAMTMNGMNELLTVARYWQRWSDPRLVFLVLNNSDLNQVTWEMRAMEGNPKYEASQTLPEFHFARYAELCGLRGLRMERPEDVVSVWREALSSDRPVLVDAVTDPEVPPLPPHVSMDQATAMLKTLVAGDPEAKDMVRHSFKGKLEELLHRGD
ncbi:MAG TPA: thiamine pyrophosphate-requiring protein [Thermoanaerobaculia bacterium]|nr:thiamine pyrophosphate-requiring protein [Thermoanaerobaculia bacterium]